MGELIKVESSDWGPHICKGLKELYDEKIGCNVAIYGSDGGTLESHACVLMAVSPTLKTWLAGDPIQGCHSVEIDTITCDTWKLLLEFIYSGQVKVEKDHVREMFDASEKLQISHLSDACRAVMKSPRKSLNPKPLGNQENKSLNLSGCNETLRKHEHDDSAEDLSLVSSKINLTVKEEVTGDQPLDLTKLTTKADTPMMKDIKKEPTEKGPQTILPGFPPGTDPQMQAVMAVYYNQMLQYSMMAQNMKNGPLLGGVPQTPQLPGAPSPLLPPPPVSAMLPMMPSTMAPNDNGNHDGRQRKFPCSICGMLFFTRHVKEQHELTHTNLKPYSCNICGFRARQKAVIWRHKKNRHPDADSSVSMDVLTTSMPSSPECEDEEDNQSTNSSRIAPSPDNNKPVMPTSKPAEMINYSNLSTVPTSAINMPVCPVPSLMPSDPSKPYVCNTCGRGFKNKYILSQHAMIHSNVRRYACDICGFRAKQMSVIYNHKRNKHWGKKDDAADYSQMINGDGNFDMSNPLNLLANSAIACTKAAKRAREANGNIKQVEYEVMNAKQTADGYLCRMCGNSVKSRPLLQDHIMKHFNIRRYQCGYCNHSAKKRTGLFLHMKTKHKGIRMVHSFMIKQKGMASKRPLFVNNSFIPSRRKFTCRTCNKSFRMKHVLAQHELIHLNIKRFSCKYCGFRGKQKAMIYKHNDEIHRGLKACVMDLLRPRHGIPEKITPPLPSEHTKPNVNPSSQDINKQEFSNKQENNYISFNKTKFEPVVIKPQADVQKAEELSYLTDRLKSQIMTQPKHFENVASLTPKLMGSNLVYSMTFPDQRPPSSTPIKCFTPPSISGDKMDHPPALFPSYGTPDKPHRCKVCGRCFRLRHVMEQHELTHSNFRKYMCDICGFRAKQKAVIYRHKKVKHPNHPGAGRVALAPDAGDSIDSSSKLSSPPSDFPPQLIPVKKQMSPSDNPEIAHNNNKNIPNFSRMLPHSINGGANRFMESQFDKINALKHGSPLQGMGWYLPPDKDDSEDDEEICEFSTGDSLSTNMAMGLPSMVPSSKAINLSLPPMAPLSPEQGSPTDEFDKKYSCQVCGRSFKHRHVLEQHYITHTGLRPYKCEYCDFCARQKASLWRHRQKHLVGGPLAMQ